MELPIKKIDHLAPITLFVYNRLEHTRKTVEALQKNELAIESDLIVFSDGFKKSPESQSGVLAVREYLKTISGFKSVKVIERLENFGLAKSIISGVTEIVDQYGKIIVLEDDLITSPYFLRYLNSGLNVYEKEDKVISIHGYMYPINIELPDTSFIKGADCWGWATWKRGWDLFEADGQKLLNELKAKKLTKEFDFNFSYPYIQMLKMQIKGLNNSWAIRWYASAFVKNKLTLYPKKSLVYQIGFDRSGTHGGKNNMFKVKLYNEQIDLQKIEIKENLVTRHAIENFFRFFPNRIKILLSQYKNYIRLILK